MMGSNGDKECYLRTSRVLELGRYVQLALAGELTSFSRPCLLLSEDDGTSIMKLHG